MSDCKQAQLLVGLARKELKALAGMFDAGQFDDEIFGFHAQQAAEKLLKAWLSTLDVEYPLTHDLSLLLETLKSKGQDIEAHSGLLDLNAYAVRFRYEEVTGDVLRLDRTQKLEELGVLAAAVERLISE